MNTHRYIARFIVEAETPLFVGSGGSSLLKDALVQTDCNGLPMILGTTLAGVLRHSLDDNSWFERIFGFAEGDKGNGSLLKVSSAYMMISETEVSEGIIEKIDDEVLTKYSNLPSRQHVRITEKGVAADKGLFDNEVVFKGTRFVFELELKGNSEDKSSWDSIIDQVNNPTFRIGSGTRNGYGSLKVISVYSRDFDLNKEDDFESYINFDPSFNANLILDDAKQSELLSDKFTKYSLKLKPDSFFIFSEGFGDDEADNRPLEEEIVVYKNGKIDFEKQTVIPASSIKGAISHRVAFYYNKLTEQYADIGGGKTGFDNEAVATLFGKAGQDSSGKTVDAQAGLVFINDFYYSDNQIANNKILNHVAIDRFTGGAMDGALFSEKVSNLLGNDFNFDVFVQYNTEDEILKSLESALGDICKGLLPLGGMTTKGHGMFTGKLVKNGKEIFNYDN
jgi:CRISPR/Cas system CSM-associated protein Csm3 (group 7 of RAMP superfamily)